MVNLDWWGFVEDTTNVISVEKDDLQPSSAFSHDSSRALPSILQTICRCESIMLKSNETFCNCLKKFPNNQVQIYQTSNRNLFQKLFLKFLQTLLFADLDRYVNEQPKLKALVVGCSQNLLNHRKKHNMIAFKKLFLQIRYLLRQSEPQLLTVVIHFTLNWTLKEMWNKFSPQLVVIASHNAIIEESQQKLKPITNWFGKKIIDCEKLLLKIVRNMQNCEEKKINIATMKYSTMCSNFTTLHITCTVAADPILNFKEASVIEHLKDNVSKEIFVFTSRHLLQTENVESSFSSQPQLTAEQLDWKTKTQRVKKWRKKPKIIGLNDDEESLDEDKARIMVRKRRAKKNQPEEEDLELFEVNEKIIEASLGTSTITTTRSIQNEPEKCFLKNHKFQKQEKIREQSLWKGYVSEETKLFKKEKPENGTNTPMINEFLAGGESQKNEKKGTYTEEVIKEKPFAEKRKKRLITITLPDEETTEQEFVTAKVGPKILRVKKYRKKNKQPMKKRMKKRRKKSDNADYEKYPAIIGKNQPPLISKM